MCRFVAYLGKTPITLSEILDKPTNSLIDQSRQTRKGKQGMNADGFGIGWYNHAISSEPGIFKSIQPAWNDQNLAHVAAKIQSTCFIGHVRSSTVGDVNTFNCHPFTFKDFLFCHNGTIRLFEEIKRKLLRKLTDQTFDIVKGQTDSEHFFALLMDVLFQQHSSFELEQMADTIKLTVDEIHKLQGALSESTFSRLNTVLTNGKQLIATRYISDTNEKPLTLFYTKANHVDTQHTTHLIPISNAVLVASEPLTDCAEEWLEVPNNHMLLVNEDLEISVQPIEQ